MPMPPSSSGTIAQAHRIAAIAHVANILINVVIRIAPHEKPDGNHKHAENYQIAYHMRISLIPLVMRDLHPQEQTASHQRKNGDKGKERIHFPHFMEMVWMPSTVCAVTGLYEHAFFEMKPCFTITGVAQLALSPWHMIIVAATSFMPCHRTWKLYVCTTSSSSWIACHSTAYFPDLSGLSIVAMTTG
jgi:hypothetical protein